MSYKLITVCTLLVVFLAACSTSKNHKILSVFFDGVPEPQKTTVRAGSDSSAVSMLDRTEANVQKITFHPPFQERECDSCHEVDNGNVLVDEQPELCFNCHDDFRTELAVLHAPVEEGTCTECHNPHKSKNQKLLVVARGDICFECHDVDDVKSNESHEDIELNACLECHNPHGGDDEFLF